MPHVLVSTTSATSKVTAFRSVSVYYLTEGGTQIYWELDPHLRDPQPHTFQLQVGNTGLADADDWENVGSPVIDGFTQTDPTKRRFGMSWDAHYRVKLTTPVDTYYSDPTPTISHLEHRPWRLFLEILRKENLRHRYASANGYLLKRRSSGEPCGTCQDELTEETINPYCRICYGTGYVGGYYKALPNVRMDLGLERQHVDLDTAMRGTVGNVTVPARFLGSPFLTEGDVWVHKESDRRYYVHQLQQAAAVHGIPLVVNIELRLAPASDLIYQVSLS